MSDSSRYSRQVLFAPIGKQGQAKLQSATAAIVGCGALGSIIAEILARAGVGRLILIDRDVLEESNLQRQFLYDMEDLKNGLPKVEAARRRIAEINPEIKVDAKCESLSENNIEELCRDAQLLIDGTDNFPARYTINAYAVTSGKPWIYGAAVGSYGLSMTVIPKETACLKCVFPQPPAPEHSPTCDTAGVIAPITAAIGSFEAAEALKILSGHVSEISRELISIDLWSGQWVKLRPQKRIDCPDCGEAKTAATAEKKSPSQNLFAESLCGRNAVQVTAPSTNQKPLEELAKQLGSKVQILSQNKFLLRIRENGQEASLFPDGRLIVWETSDEDLAIQFYLRHFGIEPS